jgi:diaminohydroxyphosphoribosylaminopyrimidine deaminase/5-amino-6-(5-phosphoribosylamino)uracil reductase
MVGATVVDRDGVIVGDGWHQQAGTPHAEIHALGAAGDRARGATLVCTLEPCCHHGRTGPCTDAIVAAGITEVIVASADPNPQVAGQGLARLEAQGVSVRRGVCEREATELNRGFFMAMREGRPWVVMKAAASSDGRVAAASGVRTSITSEDSLRRVQRLRAELDAIAVCVETVIVDDPELTVRALYRPRPFVRVIFDRQLRTPPASRVLDTTRAGPVWIATTSAAVATWPARAEALSARGATLVETGGDLAGALGVLGREGLRTLLVEGGPRLHAAFWEAGMIDEVQVFVAPDVSLPGGMPMSPGGGPCLAALADAVVEPVGRDVLVRGYVHRPH